MRLGEATRQYQATLEHERLTRAAVGGLVSFEDEVDQAKAETAHALDHLDRAWHAHQGAP